MHHTIAGLIALSLLTAAALALASGTATTA
jgi:hypothetical protein